MFNNTYKYKLKSILSNNSVSNSINWSNINNFDNNLVPINFSSNLEGKFYSDYLIFCNENIIENNQTDYIKITLYYRVISFSPSIDCFGSFVLEGDQDRGPKWFNKEEEKFISYPISYVENDLSYSTDSSIRKCVLVFAETDNKPSIEDINSGKICFAISALINNKNNNTVFEFYKYEFSTITQLNNKEKIYLYSNEQPFNDEQQENNLLNIGIINNTKSVLSINRNDIIIDKNCEILLDDINYISPFSSLEFNIKFKEKYNDVLVKLNIDNKIVEKQFIKNFISYKKNVKINVYALNSLLKNNETKSIKNVAKDVPYTFYLNITNLEAEDLLVDNFVVEGDVISVDNVEINNNFIIFKNNYKIISVNLDTSKIGEKRIRISFKYLDNIFNVNIIFNVMPLFDLSVKTSEGKLLPDKELEIGSVEKEKQFVKTYFLSNTGIEKKIIINNINVDGGLFLDKNLSLPIILEPNESNFAYIDIFLDTSKVGPNNGKLQIDWSELN